MTVNMLIQIDKLVQLLESPVFTCMLTWRSFINPVILTSHRSPPSTPRAREIPLSLQMPLRRPDAPPPKLRLRSPQESPQQRQQHRLPTRRTTQHGAGRAVHLIGFLRPFQRRTPQRTRRINPVGRPPRQIQVRPGTCPACPARSAAPPPRRYGYTQQPLSNGCPLRRRDGPYSHSRSTRSP